MFILKIKSANLKLISQAREEYLHQKVRILVMILGHHMVHNKQTGESTHSRIKPEATSTHVRELEART